MWAMRVSRKAAFLLDVTLRNREVWKMRRYQNRLPACRWGLLRY